MYEDKIMTLTERNISKRVVTHFLRNNEGKIMKDTIKNDFFHV